MANSDDGVVWSTPTRVNDSPGYYDDWFPEVAVDGVGRVFVKDGQNMLRLGMPATVHLSALPETASNAPEAKP